MQYSLLSNNNEQYITVIIDGADGPLLAGSDHPNFQAIRDIVLNNERLAYYEELDRDDRLVDLFDASVAAAKRFYKMSDRISAANGRIYLDGDEVNNALTSQILRFIDEDVSDWEPLVNFFEKVQSNPNEHSRTQLYEWLNRHEFTITPTGDIVGYKGVDRRGDEYFSVHAGPAIVDGVEHISGKVPNAIGSVIEIARGAVHHDPSVGCSTGLHVGTYEYASGFANGAVLEVHVNPRDVVSVPTDCDWQKVRCCRYEVIDAIDVPYSSAVLDTDGSDEDDDYYTGADRGYNCDDPDCVCNSDED